MQVHSGGVDLQGCREDIGLDKQRIQQLVNDPRCIPGIYNYCDRWCERCAFTSRCSNYALAEEHSILAILVYLQRLRRSTEEHFPAARSFVRPGFDTTVAPAQTSEDVTPDAD